MTDPQPTPSQPPADSAPQQPQAPAAPPPAPPPAPTQPIAGTPYTSQEALAEGYKSLQAEMTRMKQQAAQQQQPQQQQPQAPQFSWDNPNALVTDQGFSPEALQHVQQTAGMPPEVAAMLNNTVAQAQKIVQQQAQQQAVEITGSEANWQKTQEYIAGLPDDQKSAYGRALADPALYQTTLKGLTSVLEAQGFFTQEQAQQQPPGEPGAMPQVNTGTMAETPLYPNTPETIAAMKDPRYHVNSPEYDPVYRKRVEDRLMMGARQGRPN